MAHPAASRARAALFAGAARRNLGPAPRSVAYPEGRAFCLRELRFGKDFRSCGVGNGGFAGDWPRGRAAARGRRRAGRAGGAKSEKLEAVAAEIAAAGGTAAVFTLDAANEDSIKACAKAVVAQFGKLEILVNNAGITRDVLALRMKRRTGTTCCYQSDGRFPDVTGLHVPMLKAKWGAMINITSVVGEVGQSGQANYAASKAGLIGLTNRWRASWRGGRLRSMRLLRALSRRP